MQRSVSAERMEMLSHLWLTRSSRGYRPRYAAVTAAAAASGALPAAAAARDTSAAAFSKQVALQHCIPWDWSSSRRKKI